MNLLLLLVTVASFICVGLNIAIGAWGYVLFNTLCALPALALIHWRMRD